MTSSDDDQTQPVVTWHVIAWVLLTLAMSSMSQPAGAVCGRPRRHRVYLCISPFICVADALSIPVQVALARAYHKDVSWSNARRYVVYNRFRRREADGEEDDTDGIAEWPDSKTSWSRWIFFVIGTLPAFIKLISFSGIPWSQSWGLMFGLSYLTIEVFLISASQFDERLPPGSIEEALGYSIARLQLDINEQLRDEMKHFRQVIDFFDFMLLGFAYIGHFLVASWALLVLCSPISEHELSLPVDLYNVSSWILAMLTLLMLGYYFWTYLARILNATGGHVRLPYLNVSTKTKDWVGHAMLGSVVAYLIPRPKGVSERNRFHRESAMSRISSLILIGYSVYILRIFLSRLFRRHPRVQKLLLASSYRQAGDVSLTERTMIEEDAFCVASFCASLGITITWYSFGYNPVGTSNPVWTDVFG